jgi:hypothetical protein
LVTSLLLAVRRQHGDDQRGGDAERVEPDLGAEPEEHSTGRAREADEGEGVAGEGLAAKDHVPTDESGDDRGDRAGSEGVDHERELEELAQIGRQVPRQLRVDAGGGQRPDHAHQCTCRSV